MEKWVILIEYMDGEHGVYSSSSRDKLMQVYECMKQMEDEHYEVTLLEKKETLFKRQ